jgi:hypothetical protein
MMRRFVMVALVAVAASTMPAMVWADGANQEAAKQICVQLRESGQLGGRKIAVKYFNGTVWLQGEVSSQEQLNKLVAAAMTTPGVTISRVVPDGLTVESAAGNPLRNANRAQAVPSSYSASHGATTVSMMQAVPPTTVPTPSALPDAPNALPAGSSGVPGAPLPMYAPGAAVGGPAPVRYDHPAMPAYAWPSYAAYPNYAAVTYPKQYSPTAFPYIGPFYPYPQVPLGWRKVSLQWDDGWWWLDFKDKPNCCWWR